MLRILLIDDDSVEQKLLDAFLTLRFGDDFELIYSESVPSGIQLLEHQTVDYVLLDNRIPPYSDYRVTAPMVREAAPDTPLIVISACTNDSIWEGAKSLGIQHVIDKFELSQEITGGLFG